MYHSNKKKKKLYLLNSNKPHNIIHEHVTMNPNLKFNPLPLPDSSRPKFTFTEKSSPISPSLFLSLSIRSP